ncbi:MAG: hypothetical protein QOF76_2142, partial [Solirubrobacteraceae bacterium]|nr:hypothetical protein [Solirubrobacteraceae bacterium]
MSDHHGITGSTAREIAASVEAAVSAGGLEPGATLPSVRRLAADLGVSPTTVSGAVGELRRRGIVVSRPRSGVQVADRPPLAAGHSGAVPAGVRDLATGNPDYALLPNVVAAFARLDPAEHHVYGAEAVHPALRAAAVAALTPDGVDPTHLCVVNGALDGIERTLGAYFAGGDAVAVEDPGFPAVLDLVRPFGMVPMPVAIDDRGMRPEALAAALRAGARAVILTPRGQNPRGAAMDAARARELRRVLDDAPGVLVVEDDHLGPIAGSPAVTLAAGRERWVTLRSVSKWLSPDLRLAVLAGDERTVGRVQGRQAVGPGWVSTLTQRVVAALWADPEVEGLTDQAATVYAGRRRALVNALAVHGIEASAPSGLNVWIGVEEEGPVVAGLQAAGWAVSPGARFRLRS